MIEKYSPSPSKWSEPPLAGHEHIILPQIRGGISIIGNGFGPTAEIWRLTVLPLK